MPAEIGKLAHELLHDPVKVSVTPSATTVEKVDQRVIFVEAGRKRALLAELLSDPKMSRTIVFTRTKRGADKVASYLDAAGISAAAIHGDKSQGQRERALASFKAGACRALVATDIAARGIDVDGVSHVVNFELPYVAESYVHRIGRTARAGAAGSAVSLCADDERNLLRDIQKVTRQTIASFDRRNDRSLGAMVAVEAKQPQRPAPRQEQRKAQPNGQPNRNRQRSRPSNAHGSGRPSGGGQRQGGQPTRGSWSPVGA